MIEYTKGEWKVVSGMVETSTGIPIARMDREPGNGTIPVERDVNAHLIAAAPDMYEACQLVDRAWVGDGVDMATAVDAVLLALAKAEGQE